MSTMEDIEQGPPGNDSDTPTNERLQYNDEDDCPSVRLEKEINVRDLMSEKGTEFTVKDSDTDVTIDDGWDLGEDDGYGDGDEDCVEPPEVYEEMNSAVNVGMVKEGEASETPFQRTAKTMTDITEDSSGKVLKKIMKPGVGPVVPERSIVRVHYTGRFEYSEEPYDSSYLQNKTKPRSFKLGDGLLIAGMELAISTMRKDEICLVLIHPDYNMGKLGCPPRVPPNATALFRIHLESFSDRTGVHDYYDMRMAERKEAPMETILQVMRIEKDEGKKFFKNGRYRPALNKYKRALNILEECHLADEPAERKQQQELIILYRNAAACANKLGEANRTIMYANSAIRINPKDVKAWFFKGKGLSQQGEFDQARNAFMKAKKLDSNNTEITAALQLLETKFKQFSMMEAATYKRMFAGINAIPNKANPQAETDKTSCTEKENAPPNPVEDPLLQVSTEFREHAHTQMQKFKDNPDMDNLPFPSSRLTIGEIKCLVEAAEEIGLTVQEVGSGSNHHYQFGKRPEPSS